MLAVTRAAMAIVFANAITQGSTAEGKEYVNGIGWLPTAVFSTCLQAADEEESDAIHDADGKSSWGAWGTTNTDWNQRLETRPESKNPSAAGGQAETLEADHRFSRGEQSWSGDSEMRGRHMCRLVKSWGCLQLQHISMAEVSRLPT